MAEGLREGYLSLGLFAILIGQAVARLVLVLPLAQLVAAGVWGKEKQRTLLRTVPSSMAFYYDVYHPR